MTSPESTTQELAEEVKLDELNGTSIHCPSGVVLPLSEIDPAISTFPALLVAIVLIADPPVSSTD